MGLYVDLVSKAARGEAADATRVAAARRMAAVCLDALSEFLGERAWLEGDALTLADLHLAPMFDYFMKVPEGLEMVRARPALDAWWRRVADRPSFVGTRPTA